MFCLNNGVYSIKQIPETLGSTSPFTGSVGDRRRHVSYFLYPDAGPQIPKESKWLNRACFFFLFGMKPTKPTTPNHQTMQYPHPILYHHRAREWTSTDCSHTQGPDEIISILNLPILDLLFFFIVAKNHSESTDSHFLCPLLVLAEPKLSWCFPRVASYSVLCISCLWGNHEYKCLTLRTVTLCLGTLLYLTGINSEYPWTKKQLWI